jgi:cyclomaltodextrinase
MFTCMVRSSKSSLRSVLVVATCLSLISSLGAQQLTAHPVADWIKSAVIYEVNPRTFSTAGTFKGIESRLDGLNGLGVTLLWLMPIHPIGQIKKKGTVGSAYAVQDYYGINPAYGTKDDLKHLVAAAHQRGLKVIIDIVANHTAWDSVLLKQHPDWFKHDAQGNIIPANPDWTDVAGLDYRHPELRAYMTDMLKYWLREFDLDGFRCDVAGEVPTDFWENARAELTKIKPEIIMLAEANKPELLVKAFDLDYAWPFHSTMTDVLENGKPATAIPENWRSEREHFPKGALEMRFSDDHDEKRAIVRFGERGALAASAIVFTMDGIPLLYNGMEAGDTTESTAPALFENMPVFWQISERRALYPNFYKQMIALRKAHSALQQGETEWLHNSANDRILSYIRRGGGEEFLIAVNTSNQPFTGVIDAPTGEYIDVTPGLDVRKIAWPAVSLEAFEFRIYRKNR